MPQRLFVASSQVDRSAVGELVSDARALGFSVALDDGLPGGSGWWSGVLDRIDQADVFIYAIGVNSLDSEVCMAQYHYAAALDIPVLPVLVGENVGGNLTPPTIAGLQYVDYRSASKRAMADLYRSIGGLAPRVKREAPRPDVPAIVAFDLPEQSRADDLSPTEQRAIAAQIGVLLRSGVTIDRLQPVIDALRGRDDITVPTDNELAALGDAHVEKTEVHADLVSDAFVGSRPRSPASPVRNVFISYSRSELDLVSALAEDLSRSGFEVWLDQELPGGTAWWDEILRQIVETDAFVVAASHNSQESRACAVELEYARALRKPTVQVVVDPELANGSRRPDVTYIDKTKGELASLILKLRVARTQALPDVMPASPPVPATYLFDLQSEIRTAQRLMPDQQLKIIDSISRHRSEGLDPGDLAKLADDMRRRADLTVPASRALDTLMASVGPASLEPPHPATGVDPSRDTAPDEDHRAVGPAADLHAGDDPTPIEDPQPAATVAPDAADDETAPATAAASEPPVPNDLPGSPHDADGRPSRPATESRSRSMRFGVGAVAVLAVAAVIGVAVNLGGADDRGVEDRADQARPRATSTTRAEDRVTTTIGEVVDEPDSTVPFAGLEGALDVVWIANGQEHSAELEMFGEWGIATVSFFDYSLAEYVTIEQDLEAYRVGDDVVLLGFNPRLAASDRSSGLYPPSLYSPDNFYLAEASFGWSVIAVCDNADQCGEIQ